MKVQELIDYQLENAKKVIHIDTFNKDKVTYIAGVDISFDKKNPLNACAYITICDSTNKIVYENHKKLTMNMEYISGLLGFREVPVYMDLLNEIKTNKPEFYPDIVMIDGFGILHHRGFGSATHLGVNTNLPTIGVAKTLLCIDGLDEKIIKKSFKENCKKKGDYIKLIGDSGKIYGVAFKSADNVTNPIYISIGHKISLETAIEIVNKACIYRIPEMVRNSDIQSKTKL